VEGAPREERCWGMRIDSEGERVADARDVGAKSVCRRWCLFFFWLHPLTNGQVHVQVERSPWVRETVALTSRTAPLEMRYYNFKLHTPSL
jgi:hypothetical protein